MNLWDFQRDAVWAIVETFSAWLAAGRGGGLLLQSPTGSGKTVMAMAVVEWALARGLRVLFLAPRDELIKQTVAHVQKWHKGPLCVIRGGRVEGDPSAPIVIASIQTLVSKSFAPRADLVVLDEARHYVAAEWGRIAGSYPRALRLLLDATPAREDGAALGDLAEDLLVAATVEELQALWRRTGGTQGLCPVVHLSPPAYQDELSAEPLKAYLKRGAGGRAIFYAATRAEAERQAALFAAHGVPSEAVDGVTSAKRRDSALERFAEGALRVLWNVDLFTEGLDVPGIEVVGLARRWKSVVKYLQAIGRGTRAAGPEKRLTVLDLHGLHHIHGLFTAPRTYHLDGEPIRRVEGLPAAVQCRACLSWGSGGGRCDRCGAVLAVAVAAPPKVKAAELRPVLEAKPPQVKEAAFERMVRQEIGRGNNPWRAVHRFGNEGRGYGAIDASTARRVILRVQAEVMA